MVTSAFEGSSSEQLADPGLQLGFGHNFLLTLYLAKPSLKRGLETKRSLDWQKVCPQDKRGMGGGVSGYQKDKLLPTKR